MGNEKIRQIYEIVADMTLEQVKREKETKLSEESKSLISLTLTLHNAIACYPFADQI